MEPIRNILNQEELLKLSELNGRYTKALELRRAGSTLKKIGEYLNVGPERARQMVGKAERHLKHPLKHPSRKWPEISARSLHWLLQNGHDSKGKIIDAVKSGQLHPFSKQSSGYGWKTHKEVCTWLGIKFEKIERVRPIKDKTINQYIAILEKRGFKVYRPSC